MASKSNEKRARNVLSIKKKVEIIKKLESGVSYKSLQKTYGVGKSTIYDIKMNHVKILNYFKNSNSVQAMEKRKTLRTAVNPELDDALYEWYMQQINEGIYVTVTMITEKAFELHELMKVQTPCEYSVGWLQRFKQRHGICSLGSTFEKISESDEPDNEFNNNALDEILMLPESLAPELVYSDETGVFWKCPTQNDESVLCERQETTKMLERKAELVNDQETAEIEVQRQKMKNGEAIKIFGRLIKYLNKKCLISRRDVKQMINIRQKLIQNLIEPE